MLSCIGLAVLIQWNSGKLTTHRKSWPSRLISSALAMWERMPPRISSESKRGRRRTSRGRRLDVHTLAQSRHLLVREELDDGAVDGAVLAEGDPGQALSAKRGGHAGKLIDLGTCPGTGALGVDSLDDRASSFAAVAKTLNLELAKMSVRSTRCIP